MSIGILSRRNLMQLAAAVSAGIAAPRAAQASSPSTELLGLQESLLEARAKRDLLHQIVRDAERKRPANPGRISDPHTRTHQVNALAQFHRGQHDPTRIVGADDRRVCTAQGESGFDRQATALEAAESVVCDIEKAIVDFEPRSIADLRLQVELALHQELIDYGMDENLPRLICTRFLRLIPAQFVSRDQLEAISNARRKF